MNDEPQAWIKKGNLSSKVWKSVLLTGSYNLHVRIVGVCRSDAVIPLT